MKNRKYFLLTFISIFIALISCTKDVAELRLPFNSVPVITGILFKDELGSSIRIIGEPNSNLIYISDIEEIRITIFPNIGKPGKYSPYINVETNFQSFSANIWMVCARFEPSIAGRYFSPDVVNVCNSAALVAGGEPLIYGRVEIPSSTGIIRLEAGDLVEGFYRIYVEIDNKLLWDDLMISHEFEF
jgi:hypothetical protein